MGYKITMAVKNNYNKQTEAIKQENFDYTKWQREYFDNKDDTELFEEIKSFCDRYHYKGNATIL